MEWVSVKDRTPDLIEGENYSKNVLAVLDGQLAVMNLVYVIGDDDLEGGYAWANCYGDIHADGEWDDEYEPTHWMPLPELPTN